MTDIDDIALRLADVERAMAELTEEADRLRGILAAAMAPGQVVDAGTLAAITVAKVDGAALKRVSVALWEACAPAGEPFLAKVVAR